MNSYYNGYNYILINRRKIFTFSKFVTFLSIALLYTLNNNMEFFFPSSLEELKDEPLCQHAIEGNCTNTNCVFLHGFQCDHCKKPVIHPFDRIQGRTHVELCSRTAGVS